ncbi:hypothetical protein [Anditalea andensis]|uniref:Uncharacterized protein n=1 Tax=Anditalea andensis TaxID=1048983 RepID=A0A074KXM6_9BACT|nr:hypothetical protein [Anditalea andensis]KEO74726.1 hypothetical protein EL17_03350 [Anditalea andensis]
MKNPIIFISLFNLLFFSCINNEEDIESIIEEEIIWVQHPFYQHDLKAMRGIFQLDNYILTQHDFGYGVRIYEQGNEQLSNFFVNLLVSQVPGRKHMHIDLSFPVNEKYFPVCFVEIPKSIFVYSLRSPMQINTAISGLEIKGEDIDPDFRDFYIIGSFRGNMIELKDDFLFVAYNVKAETNPHPLKFAIIELKQDLSGFGVGTELVSIKTINSPQKEDLFGNLFSSVLPVNDGFVISTSFKLFKFYFDGTVKVFERNNIDKNDHERYTESILIKDPKTNVILCLDISNMLDSYYSMDDGETWDLLKDFHSSNDFSTLDMIRYIHHNDELYGIYNSQLFKISITPNHFAINELDNTGLEGHKITGISHYQKDSLVMVSSRSGAFYKPANELDKPKINAAMNTIFGGL